MTHKLKTTALKCENIVACVCVWWGEGVPLALRVCLLWVGLGTDSSADREGFWFGCSQRSEVELGMCF